MIYYVSHSLFLLFTITFKLADANSSPNFEFKLELKTPQLIGIIAGFCVFVITVSAVVYLLYKSGSWGKFVTEMQSGKPLVIHSAKVNSVTMQEFPKLYDHLLDASKANQNILTEFLVESERVTIRPIDISNDNDKYTRMEKNGKEWE